MQLNDKILQAGVVGAGGGGFPTHIKANSKVEFVIANGAECEPLLHKDFEIMVNFPEEIVKGMELMMEITKARKGYFGIKGKNALAIKKINPFLENTNIQMDILGDYYPIGDEYELVYECTKRLIPPKGIPLDVGCLVNNVETFYNVFKAYAGEPVTDSFLCVTGEVNSPKSMFVPIGTSFRDVIKIAGDSKLDQFGVFVSGLLMGRLTFDLDEVVTKTTAGLIVFPKNHYMIQRMDRSFKDMNRIGKSACDQCSYCTEFCPRYLLGYDVQPHKVMRTLEFSKTGTDYWNQFADLCCECNLCTMYSCPEDLYPAQACINSKAEMRKQRIGYTQKKEVKVHPIQSGRRVPLKQLMKKLNVEHYNFHTPFSGKKINPDSVRINLKQHAGVPSTAIVVKGTVVSRGDLIAKVEENKLGANIHSSINGIVEEVNNEYIKIGAN